MRFYLLFFFIVLHPIFVFAQKDSSTINKKRLVPLAIGSNILYTGALFYLNSVWYSKEDRSSFHFFNDFPEWKQMDKVGHVTTSFHEAMLINEALLWSGVDKNKAVVLAGISGFVYQAPIELLDGYATTYGASVSDLTANALGALLFITQGLVWNDQKILPKISYHETRFAALRPDVLGKTFGERVLKDYNGQTYWLSANISSFLPLRKEYLKILNISLGYSASDMIFARDFQNAIAGMEPYRQFFFSLDIDFRNVKTKRRWLRYLLYPLNIIHIPFPALEINKHKLVFHPIYF